MLIDSHVNLHGEKFADDLPEVITRAKAAGVKGMLNICCNIKDYEATVNVAKLSEAIWASVGTHPHDAKENPNITAQQLVDLALHPKIIGIGETGLDFHYGYSSEAEQRFNFQAHIEAARELQIPLIIHTREADDLMRKILDREMSKGTFPALLHCYTSGLELAKDAIDMGLYFSVSGIVTFKNAHDVRSIIEIMPDERIMIETDCPYLAPVPHRGRRNEPAYVHEVCQGLAEVKGWTYEEAAQHTTNAFFNLFQKADRGLLWD
ncbi:TatD DNase family protein [Litorimonas taeanensis]|uniref:TatD DNase family protein n=1 Tax=Litorimonas taeanensis TaxID=568099 RepID=A0A420WKC5_9PROT|nr:TatD family hydrolase [Litorimonas taeanensis]RKQ71372.1 TatD DNase family protein [Litorimonas taeanensis]